MTRDSISVLHLDDTEGFLELTKIYLKQKDKKFKTMSVTDGKLFLLKTLHTNYDLFLVDYSMQPLDGLKILKELRNREINTPFILLTGRYKNSEIMGTLEKYEHARYIQKKIDFKSFIHVLVKNIEHMIFKYQIAMKYA